MRSFLATSLLASLALASAPAVPAAQGLTILSSPSVLGLGDSGVITVIGMPGDFAFLLTSLTPGPIQLPIVGQMEVGEDGLDYVVFGALPANGVAQFFCTLPCSVTTPVYLQAVTIVGSPLRLSEKSPQLVLTIDPTLIDDCDGNGVDDDCDLQAGRVEDCNGNGLPDSCDIASGRSQDVDMDGVPDECCDPICSLVARYTIDGPVMAFPWLLTLTVVAPGTPGSGQSEIQVAVPSAGALPTSVSSPNGTLVADQFALTANGGISCRVTYKPPSPSQFGNSIILVGEVEGHCERRSIGSGLLVRCDLVTGMVLGSTGDPGSFVVEAVVDTCP